MSELKDFLYLDTAKLYSFISQIHGGLISKINETIKQLGGISAGINISLPPVGGKIDASKRKESERQQTLLLTDPAYFNLLHQYLTKENSLEDISSLTIKQRAKLEVGQFIEFQGLAEPPIVENWIARVNTLFGFLERNMKLIDKFQKGKGKSSLHQTNMQMREFRGIMQFLEDYMDISRKDPGKQYIKLSTTGGDYKIWCGLIPDYVTVSLQATLPVNVRVFGRIERMMNPEEIYKIVDFSQFDQATGVDKLLEALNSLSSIIRQQVIEEGDLQARYPDVFISPIGIYR